VDWLKIPAAATGQGDVPGAWAAADVPGAARKNRIEPTIWDLLPSSQAAQQNHEEDLP
jgi:hypothetical protein